MVAVVPADRTADALTLLAGRGVPAWTIGHLAAASGGSQAAESVELVADYAGIAATWR
jgi:phosphoribosylaminoimidazole (AIR) synthetase